MAPCHCGRMTLMDGPVQITPNRTPMLRTLNTQSTLAHRLLGRERADALLAYFFRRYKRLVQWWVLGLLLTIILPRFKDNLPAVRVLFPEIAPGETNVPTGQQEEFETKPHYWHLILTVVFWTPFFALDLLLLDLCIVRELLQSFTVPWMIGNVFVARACASTRHHWDPVFAAANVLMALYMCIVPLSDAQPEQLRRSVTKYAYPGGIFFTLAFLVLRILSSRAQEYNPTLFTNRFVTVTNDEVYITASTNLLVFQIALLAQSYRHPECYVVWRSRLRVESLERITDVSPEPSTLSELSVVLSGHDFAGGDLVHIVPTARARLQAKVNSVGHWLLGSERGDAMRSLFMRNWAWLFSWWLLGSVLHVALPQLDIPALQVLFLDRGATHAWWHLIYAAVFWPPFYLLDALTLDLDVLCRLPRFALLWIIGNIIVAVASICAIVDDAIFTAANVLLLPFLCIIPLIDAQPEPMRRVLAMGGYGVGCVAGIIYLSRYAFADDVLPPDSRNPVVLEVDVLSVSAAELYSNSVSNVVLFMLGLLMSAIFNPNFHWLEGCRLRVERIGGSQLQQWRQQRACGRTGNRTIRISKRSGQSRRAVRSQAGDAQASLRRGVSERSGQERTLNPLVDMSSQQSTGVTFTVTNMDGQSSARSQRTDI